MSKFDNLEQMKNQALQLESINQTLTEANKKMAAANTMLVNHNKDLESQLSRLDRDFKEEQARFKVVQQQMTTSFENLKKAANEKARQLSDKIMNLMGENEELKKQIRIIGNRR
jgi:predicted  nucleic acid-binding Zn-ribbon protein